MTVAVVVLGVVILVLLWMRHTEQADARADAQEQAQERQTLLDRIQHPERVAGAIPADYEPPGIPTDEAELAQIGQEVPDGADVGNPLDDQEKQLLARMVREERELEHVGQEVPADVHAGHPVGG